jgi:hypothetical protein
VPPRNPSGASGCWSGVEDYPPGAGPRRTPLLAGAMRGLRPNRRRRQRGRGAGTQ